MGLQVNLQNRTKRNMDQTIRIRPEISANGPESKYKLDERDTILIFRANHTLGNTTKENSIPFPGYGSRSIGLDATELPLAET
jgi:hypothetical protein